ncbi:hypothetical protein EV356DRAFT_201381 [Viridothelium virens]|uniref:Rhodopsin domain-containing protein n=1 Tax=Viridothelium virens TaxID=1048519 RepID=A0A6A6H612_VIRVR|nr:hypothetical protein EV356DRAFT_201381 [Viridothelium virens]
MALESSALNNNETRAPAMLAIVWTECALGIVFIILRFWCRYRIRALGIDDWIMSFSVALTIVTASLITVLAQNGGFRHLASLPADTHSRAVKLDWIEQPSMVFNFGVSKVSTSLLILRLMSPNSKKTRRLLYFIIAITTLLTTLAVIFIFAQCKPPRALWTPNIPAKCWRPEDYSSFTLGQGAWYILVDFLLAIIPSFIIWNLKMKRTKRIGLSIVFSFGVLAGICGCAKMPTLKNLNSRSDITCKKHHQF